ncbi:MAG: aminoacyl-tRNA hydrolase, partial [Clostridia bacterium]|nr:aminoacyl-tRNA hydrolase [Clostridia bacterium]
QIGGVRCLLMKPQTFMNLSGEAVKEACSFYKIPPENVIVAFDDISLPCGGLRIRRKGSAGGHNGIKSIIQHLGSDNFPRIKLGVGAKPHPDYDLADYVLSNFAKDDIPLMKQAMEKGCDALEFMVKGKIDEAMSKYSH